MIELHNFFGNPIFFHYQVFACIGAVQAVISFISPIYQIIYRETYDWHKGFVYCVSCTLLAFMFFLTLYVNLFMKNHSKKVKKTISDNEKQEVAQEPIEMKKESYKNIMADEQVDEKGL